MGGCEVRTAPFTRTAPYSPVSSAVKLGYRGFGLLGAVKRGVREGIQFSFLTLVPQNKYMCTKGAESDWLTRTTYTEGKPQVIGAWMLFYQVGSSRLDLHSRRTTTETLTFDFCLSTSIPVLTTSTYVVAWPQGDQILGGGLVTQGHGRTSEPGKHTQKKEPSTWEGKKYDKRRNHLILVGKPPDAQVVP